MKILITAAQFSSDISGIQRHALNLVLCLLKQAAISEVHLVVAPWQLRLVDEAGLKSIGRLTIHPAEMSRGVLSRNLWYYSRLPELVEHVQPQIVHLSYPVPINRSAIPLPIVLSLHDLYPVEIPDNFGFPKAIFNRAILQQCLRSVQAIACVSDTTLQRMKQYAPRAAWKALRIYNCVEPDDTCAERSPIPHWRGEPFLLSVSQHRKNKNVSLLIRVMHRLLRAGPRIPSKLKLIVIGISGPETHRIHRLVSDLQLNEHVVFLRGLAEPELQWCYRHCEVLVAPSKTEGFGLPVAEALLAGCRVVCSDIPAFREIDEEHCQFVRLGADAEERFADAIIASLDRPPAPPLSFPHFSSETLGADYVNLYRKLLPDSARVPGHPVLEPMQMRAPERSSL